MFPTFSHVLLADRWANMLSSATSPCCLMCATTLTESNKHNLYCVFCTCWCEWSTNKGKSTVLHWVWPVLPLQNILNCLNNEIYSTPQRSTRTLMPGHLNIARMLINWAHLLLKYKLSIFRIVLLHLALRLQWESVFHLLNCVFQLYKCWILIDLASKTI